MSQWNSRFTRRRFSKLNCPVFNCSNLPASIPFSKISCRITVSDWEALTNSRKCASLHGLFFFFWFFFKLKFQLSSLASTYDLTSWLLKAFPLLMLLDGCAAGFLIFFKVSVICECSSHCLTRKRISYSISIVSLLSSTKSCLWLFKALNISYPGLAYC